ncbi:hypothetical protein Natpe_2404 [Natrinema pellirubrum DSM 15624]|uniref:Uncharacterized protein n=1 Tax=Natrinema pellirubrum (strain DSM 15624 / CIP 106293 / JCM 10476 / NCIMB 786 / 157) TaxID=797303 RepID=L0JL14_NATP1|nr:hypothetical protein Natpe_2404 [Natrinema pellirubrum DSM 15624]
MATPIEAETGIRPSPRVAMVSTVAVRLLTERRLITGPRPIHPATLVGRLRVESTVRTRLSAMKATSLSLCDYHLVSLLQILYFLLRSISGHVLVRPRGH